MSAESPGSLTEPEIAALLSSGGTGVLSLAKANTPYAVPVSYAFDAEARTFYLRLGDAGDSEKFTFLDASESVRLVVYDDGPDRTWSVVAAGTIDVIPDSELTPALVERLADGEYPQFDLWDESKSAIDFTIARLAVTELTGRSNRDDG